MLKATFQCFKGIGPDMESRLWRRGCLSWRDYVSGGGDFMSAGKQKSVAFQIEEAESAWSSDAVGWFLSRLKGAASLRVLYDFMSDALFLDIETTGLGPGAQVTSVATWRNGVTRCFVRGFNLDRLLDELEDAKLLVTFNGKRFDLPFLRYHFACALDIPHLDLMYPLRALGYRGGLKVCERALDFQRVYSEGTDGFEAVRLWYAWRNRGDFRALRKLIVYNIEDTYSLAWLAAVLVSRCMSDYPHIPSCRQPSPPAMSEVLDEFGLPLYSG